MNNCCLIQGQICNVKIYSAASLAWRRLCDQNRLEVTVFLAL